MPQTKPRDRSKKRKRAFKADMDFSEFKRAANVQIQVLVRTQICGKWYGPNEGPEGSRRDTVEVVEDVAKRMIKAKTARLAK